MISTSSNFLRRSHFSTISSLYYDQWTLGASQQQKPTWSSAGSLGHLLVWSQMRIYPQRADWYLPQVFTEKSFGRALASSRYHGRSLEHSAWR